ncbi:hypothetical protein PENSPDRAFT_738809 [Peniophora sp. CONT]|nr:hypothetical protein PENSPDRAFT_738809 [Peniophora sp. CONT]
MAGSAARAALLDQELETMQRLDIITLAKQRRNMVIPACRLPAELLTRIASFAQLDWAPSRKRGNRVSTLGWIGMSHVCSSWRMVLVSTPSLWCSIPCLELSPRCMPDVLARTRHLGLTLTLTTNTFADATGPSCAPALRLWMGLPISRRTRHLLIKDGTETFRANSWSTLLLHSMPMLESLSINLGQGSSAHARDDLVLPGDMFGSISPPRLSSIKLSNCSLPWGSGLYSASVTYLSLIMDPRNTATSPTFAQFGELFARLTSLTFLLLHDVFPTSPNPAHLVRLPATLKSVRLGSSANGTPNDCLGTFIRSELPIQASYSISIAKNRPGFDNDLVSRSITHLFHSPPEPPVELFLHYRSFVVNFNPRWNASSMRGGTKWFQKFVDQRQRYLKVSDNQSHDDALFPNLHRMRLESLKYLNVTGETMSLMNSTQNPEWWKSTFTSARHIVGLAVDYVPELIHLLCALADDSSSLLFPLLKTVILCRYADGQTGNPVTLAEYDAAQLQVSLIDFLHVRKQNGALTLELRVEEGALGPEELRRVEEVVNVVVF